MSSFLESWNPQKTDYHNTRFNPDVGKSGPHKSNPSGKSVFSLYVTNIPPELTNNALGNLFGTYGRVICSKILQGKSTALGGKAGFIEFGTVRECECAIRNLNGTNLGKYNLKVEKARPKPTPPNDENYLSLLRKLEKGPLIEKDLKNLIKKADAESYKNPLNGNSSQANDIASSNSSFDDHQGQGDARPKSQIKKDMSGPCVVCHQMTMTMCSSCTNCFYCSRSCQEKDWKHHMVTCKLTNSQKEPKKIVKDNIDPVMMGDCSKVSGSVHKNQKLTSFQTNVIKEDATSQQDLNNSSIKPPSTIEFSKQLGSLDHIECGKVLDLIVIDIDAEESLLVCQSPSSVEMEALEAFQVKLNQHYLTSQPKAMSIVDVGEFCAAVYVADGQWYRARIEQILEDQVAIRFVDYGNKEFVKQDGLFELIDKFYEKPAFSLGIKLAGIKKNQKWFVNALELILQTLKKCSRTIRALVCEISDGDIFAEIKAGGVSINNDILQKKFAPAAHSSKSDVASPLKNECISPKSKVVSPSEEKDCVIIKGPAAPNETEVLSPVLDSMAPEPEQTILKEQELTKQNGEPLALLPVEIPDSIFDVLATHANSPDSIYFQVVQDDLFKLNEQLAELTSRFTDSESPVVPKVGMICATMYADDKVWYRAKVLEIVDDESVEVQFVDFGNIEKVSNKFVQHLPVEFYSLPMQAFEASLDGCFPVGKQWSDEIIAFAKQLLNNTFKAKVNKSSKTQNGKYQIQLHTENDESINDHLITSKLASDKSFVEPKEEEMCDKLKEIEPPINETVNVIISEVNQPGEFYCQLLTNDLIQLTELLGDLTQHCSNSQRQDFECVPGAPCAALFKDGSWYRAVIEQVDTDQVFVKYVDYGNCALISKSEIRQLPMVFGQLPAQAFKCSLADAKPAVEKSWQEDFIVAVQQCMEKPLDAKVVASSKNGVYCIKVPFLLNHLIQQKIGEYTF